MNEISIIIPHYNSVESLRKLLLSIPQRKDIEVIVIDDNSTMKIDRYNELKKNSNFSNVKFLVNDTGIQSAGACRNIGLKEAKGKWILFADSDDYFLEDFYERIKKYLISDYDAIIFNSTSIYTDTNKVANRHEKYRKIVLDYIQDKSNKNEARIRYDFTVPWSKMIKKALIDQYDITFDEVKAWNDIMFSTKVGHYMKHFTATPEVIYCVTRSEGTLTTTISNDIMDSRINVFIRYCDFVKKNVSSTQSRYLPITGFGKLLMVFKSDLGLKKVIQTYRKFRKSNVKIIDKKFLNPFFVIKRVNLYIRNHKSEKKYYIK